MKITSILENTTQKEDMITEHGLSLYIETEEQKILFDMGQSDAFYKNAQKLGIDLSRVDIAVLSHGHYDHGGGLEAFMKINSRAPIYVMREAFLPHFNATGKYIGLDTSLSESERIIYVDDECKIAPNITLYSCNKRERKHSFGAFGLTEERCGIIAPDRFLHEQYMLIEGEKRVLISGCSHKGALDIAEWFCPDVFVGGFHFSKITQKEILYGAARSLAKRKNTKFYTCHCTGVAQYEYMKEHLNSLYYLSCGDSIEL